MWGKTVDNDFYWTNGEKYLRSTNKTDTFSSIQKDNQREKWNEKVWRRLKWKKETIDFLIWSLMTQTTLILQPRLSLLIRFKKGFENQGIQKASYFLSKYERRRRIVRKRKWHQPAEQGIQLTRCVKEDSETMIRKVTFLENETDKWSLTRLCQVLMTWKREIGLMPQILFRHRLFLSIILNECLSLIPVDYQGLLFLFFLFMSLHHLNHLRHQFLLHTRVSVYMQLISVLLDYDTASLIQKPNNNLCITVIREFLVRDRPAYRYKKLPDGEASRDSCHGISFGR
jgi:hypothetical protein